MRGELRRVPPLALALAVLVIARTGPAHAEWVGTLYFGASHTYASTLHINQPATGSALEIVSVPWAPHAFSLGAPYFGLRLSYFPAARTRLGATLDFTHYKMFAQTTESISEHGNWNGESVRDYGYAFRYVQDLEVSHGVDLTSLDAQYRWNPDYTEGRWQTHIGAGMLVYLPQAQGTIDDIAVRSAFGYAGYGEQIFGGAEYTLPARLQPRGEAIKRVTLLVESKLDDGSMRLNLDPATRVGTHVTTLHLIGGVSLHF